jgi:hypothetical protein
MELNAKIKNINSSLLFFKKQNTHKKKKNLLRTLVIMSKTREKKEGTISFLKKYT